MWTPEADAHLIDHVQRFGLKKWNELANTIPNGASARQVRERWTYRLDPSINHEPWKAEEDAQMTSLFEKSSGSWSIMALSLPGRTDMQIKNRWISAFKKQHDAVLGSSLDQLDPFEFAGLLEEEAETTHTTPTSPAPIVGKRKSCVAETAVTAVTAVTATTKKPRRMTPPPCTGSGMKMITFGGFGGAGFANINAMLSMQKDARKQTWEGAGRV